jgi:hypothetical protein
VPDDVGGTPFPDGTDPDHHDHGAADDAFASVVFDESFVLAATVHEPSAVERLLSAAQARAEAEASRAHAAGELYDDGYAEYGYGTDPTAPYDHYGDDAVDPYGYEGGALRPYRGRARWHRPVAWILALIMGVGMVALAFSAVYRGASDDRRDRITPPATTVDNQQGATPARTAQAAQNGQGAVRPSASAEYTAPAVSAVPRTP